MCLRNILYIALKPLLEGQAFAAGAPAMKLVPARQYLLAACADTCCDVHSCRIQGSRTWRGAEVRCSWSLPKWKSKASRFQPQRSRWPGTIPDPKLRSISASWSSAPGLEPSRHGRSGYFGGFARESGVSFLEGTLTMIQTPLQGFIPGFCTVSVAIAASRLMSRAWSMTHI